MKEFIQVKYDFFKLNEANITPIRVIGTGGFLLYHYLLYEQSSKQTCNLTIRMIQEFLNMDYNNRPNIIYNKNKDNKVSTLKGKNTIIKYLKLLSNNGFIKIRNGISNDINKPMVIECIKMDSKGFEAFPSAVFVDYIHKIGHIGFTILCLLGKNFNANYGSCSCEGFANPTEEYISLVIGRDIKTVRAYLYLLKDLKLINIKPQPPIVTGYNECGEEMYEYIANHYEVRYKLMDNKYYLEK